MSDIKNPCIDVCRYDEDSICEGCRRTREEARNWWRYSDAEKLEVLHRIKLRGSKNSDHLDFYV